MELLRPCLFFYLLVNLLSLSISSTTNSDSTKAETLQWKGGEGAKRSRVRRQNLELQHALRLPEKAYAFYMLWKLLNEMYNDTSTIKPLTMRPEKLEFTTSEGPKNMEIKVKPSSAPIQKQSTHSVGMTGTNDSTDIASFSTEPSLLDSQKTTQLEDLQVVQQSTQRLQTTTEKITEPNQAIEQHIPDSTTSKIPSTAAEEPSTIAIHEQIDHFTGNNGTNNFTTMASFPTHSSLPNSKETTSSGDSQLVEQSVQRVQTTKQKMTEPSEVTEQHIPDSTIFSTKTSSTAAEEPSSITIHEQIDHFNGINRTNNSTAMASFPTHSSPDSLETTQSGDSQLADKSTQQLQTTTEKITEPNQAIEQHIPDSTTSKIPSTAAEVPSTIAIHEQIDHFTGNNGTNNFTTMASFPTHSLLPNSKETTSSGDSQLVEQSVQRVQTTKQKMTEPSEVTEQHIPDSTIFSTKTSSTEAGEPSSITIHEQIDHFTGINGTNNSTTMVSFPTQSSLPDLQQASQSGDSQLAEKSTQRLQTTKQKMTEPSEVTEQHIPDSTIFSTKIYSKAAEPSIALHEQINLVTGLNGTNNSTTMASFPTDSLPDSQETTQSGDLQIAEQSAQHFQTTKHKIIEPVEVTEQNIIDSTTFTIKTSSTAAEEPSSITIHEQIDHFNGINRTNNSTAMVSFPTQSSLPDLQQASQSGDSQLAEKSTQRLQTTTEKITEPNQAIEQHIPDSTTSKIPSTAAEVPSTIAIHEQIDHFTGNNGTNNFTTMASFPTHSLLPNSKETTSSGDSQLVEQSVQRVQTTKQKMTEPSEVTEQHIPDSTIFSTKTSSTAAEEPSSITIHEQIDHFTGINGTNNSTTMVSFPTQSSLPDLQQTSQSGDSQLAEKSTQRLQTTKQKMTEPSEVTEQHIPDSTIFSTKIYSKAAEPSIALHEQINHVTGLNGTNNSTTMVSFPTQSSLPDLQQASQSGDSQLAEKSTQRLQTTKQKMTEPSEVTEQHIPDSTIFSTKIYSKAAEPSIALHEQIDLVTGLNGTNNSTTMASFPTESLPDSQETTQSGDLQIAEQSAQHFQTTKHKIIEPVEVTEQNIIDSTTFTIKTSSTAAEEPSSITIHEQINHFNGINRTNNSTAMASFPTHSSPDSLETTQSGDSQLADKSTQRLQTTTEKITEPNQAIEQHIPDSTTSKIPSTAAEEPSTIAIHEQIDHFTGNNGTTNSTAVPSFPIQSSLLDSQKTTQTGDSEIVEESPQHGNRESIIRSTGNNGTNDSTPIMSFPTDLPPQESQKNTQSGAPQLLEHSTQHFQILKQKMTAPSQNIVQPTALMSTPDQATTYRIQQTTPLQSAIDPHIPYNDIIASTMENENLQPTSLPQMTKNEQSKITPVINGMVQSISKPTQPARTKRTLSTVKSEIKNSPHTLSVTWQNGKPNWLVTSTDWRVSKPTPTTFTLKQQIQDSTSLLLKEDSPNSNLSESTSDPEHHKPKPTEEPINQHTEKNITNTAKSSRDSLMQEFMTTNTLRQTNDTLNSKMASTSPLPILTEKHLVNSKGLEDTSLPTDIILQDTTSFRIYQSNAQTQSQHTTNKYTILGKMTSHTSFPLVKDTSTQAPTDGVRSSQTIPVSTEKLIRMFTPNPEPSEKHIHTTSVVRHGFLTSRTQENPSWISMKRSNIRPTETEESRSDSINQEPTVDSMPKENYTNNDLTETDKPTQNLSGRKPSTTTHIATTRTVSRKPKMFILPRHKSANTAIEDDTKARRGIFGLFFTFGCLMLLIIVILLRVIWRKWQARNCGSNMWVAGPPLLWGTYHSVLQNSSSHPAIQMRKEYSKKTKQENSDVFETIALKQQHKDLV